MKLRISKGGGIFCAAAIDGISVFKQFGDRILTNRRPRTMLTSFHTPLEVDVDGQH